MGNIVCLALHLNTGILKHQNASNALHINYMTQPNQFVNLAQLKHLYFKMEYVWLAHQAPLMIVARTPAKFHAQATKSLIQQIANVSAPLEPLTLQVQLIIASIAMLLSIMTPLPIVVNIVLWDKITTQQQEFANDLSFELFIPFFLTFED
jgi:hypothetical protein